MRVIMLNACAVLLCFIFIINFLPEPPIQLCWALWHMQHAELHCNILMYTVP